MDPHSPSSPAPSPQQTAPAVHTVHPALFLVLMVPFGLSSGFVGVTLAYQLAQQGASATAVAGVIALSLVPHTWRFLWAPLVDTLWTRKRWYLSATLLCGASLWLSGAFADHAPVALGTLSALLMASSVMATLLSMALESLMAATVPDRQRGRVSGWFQAGNLGGQGLGGGLGLWLVQGAGWTVGGAGIALGVLSAACCLALLGLPDPKPVVRVGDHVEASTRLGLVANARAIAVDLWQLVRSRIGALAVVICFLPLGSGGAQNLFAVIGGEWHATAGTIALVNGALGGVVSALGCLAGGWICDRIDRKTAYCVFGGALALAAIGMAWGGRTPAQFVVWTTVYAFVVGLSYAGYSAIVFEAIGRTAAATKFSLLAALSNMPIAYMTLLDGVTNDRWGTRGMLLIEAACGFGAIAVFAALATATRKRGAAQLAAA